MKRRWRRWVGTGLFAVLGGLLLVPDVHWPLIGWLKGEAFYQGRPTTYWRREMDRYYFISIGTAPRSWLARTWDEWDRITTGPRSDLPDMILIEDTAVIPVLVALLDEPDLNIKVGALFALRKFPTTEKGTAVPALIRLLEDEETDIRAEAIRVFGKWGPGAEVAVPALVRLLRHPEPKTRSNAAWSLAQVAQWGRLDEAAVQLLAALQDDPDAGVQFQANAALQRIVALRHSTPIP